MTKVFISTVPFSNLNQLPLELLNNLGIEYKINPLHRKLTEKELVNLAVDCDVIIAGTEPITDYVMENTKKLKMISRVGIGLDNIDLNAAKKRGIKVSYTPDAPSPAVAELTICLILSVLRSIHLSNVEIHNGEWKRYFGKRVADCTIGIIGLGRIGTRVLNRLLVFGTPRLLVNDNEPNKSLNRKFKLDWVDKETIYRESDLISLHIPLSRETKNMINKKELLMMKSDAAIVNTSRGGIINENDLYDVMHDGHLSGAAIDVFDKEPYYGKLNKIDRCLLTAHMGSMSVDCRNLMELEATQEAIRFLTGKKLKSEAPQEEYLLQKLTP